MIGTVSLDGNVCVISFVVPDDTMSIPILLGRNVLRLFGYKLTKSLTYDKMVADILNIDVESTLSSNIVHINVDIIQQNRVYFETIFMEHHYKPDRPQVLKVYAEAVKGEPDSLV